MTGVVNFDWTPERIERLGKLWQDGLTAARIAADLGNSVTRNAVLGKLHRLRLLVDHRHRRWTEADRAKIVDMVVEQKMLVPGVAVAFHATEEAVREQIKTLKKVGRIPADALSRNYQEREQARRSAALKEPKPKKAALKPKPVASPVSRPKPVVAPPPAVSISVPANPAVSRLPKVVRDVFTEPSDAYLVTTHELRTTGDCRWPYGEKPPFMYCGKPATDGPWCCEHARLAYASDPRPTMKAYAPTKSGRSLAMQREARS